MCLFCVHFFLHSLTSFSRQFVQCLQTWWRQAVEKYFNQQVCLLLFLSAQSMSVNNVSFSLKVEIYLFIQITSLYPQHSFLFIVLLLNGRDQRSNHQIRSRGFIDCKCCYSDVFNGFLVWWYPWGQSFPKKTVAPLTMPFPFPVWQGPSVHFQTFHHLLSFKVM